MEALIRSEMQTDIEGIEKITLAAFTGKPYSNQTEHLIVNELRKAGALTLSLVAEVNENVIGHIAFSSVRINEKDLGWYGIGPISVAPAFQKQGIGSKLIKEGLKQIQMQGAQGCVLLGDPAYYPKFGFKSYPELFYAGSPAPEYFMALPFYANVPKGKVEFHSAFYVGR
ncbi:MAG: N-acetyltransferase [Anaerolineales bacterium]|nr:N-acetyltransferase [Anaerolineales bacterium]